MHTATLIYGTNLDTSWLGVTAERDQVKGLETWTQARTQVRPSTIVLSIVPSKKRFYSSYS